MTWDPKIIFPETAIRADCKHQFFWDFARRMYVDIARKCRSCRRWFLFFALEQKYWFETLKFNINADCVHCHECRRASQIQRKMQYRYDELLTQTEKSTLEWNELSTLGDHLVDAGYIKKPETLLKSRIPKRLRNSIKT